MSVKAAKEPVDDGKEEIKIPKKKLSGGKLKPYPTAKILEDIDYSITKVKPHEKAHGSHTHMLEITVNGGMKRYAFEGKPKPVDIVKHHKEMMYVKK